MSDDPKRTTPIGLARYAREFFDFALAADDKIGHRPGFESIAPIPVMYLMGHSIELCLKAYLVFCGVPLRDLRTKKFGHDIVKCLKKANELGLGSLVNLEDMEYDAFEVLNELYSTKQLNYIVTGGKVFPIFGLVESVCRKLLDAVCPLVGYR
ncbi:hypothetical protein JWZ98_19155 [Methylomonas sp. EFPC1]|uniref:hypothetical protein n=1 Tax=Methylomonas sp. EFPC1 TaxID=2812647 RepID=UPI001967F505|nr:hypothetical protein [Methylomonas sp. EFPC1]QSB00748.1 hypothetical protein JWZ98_19155 [Methylomonas sp. EFPC1]